LSYKDYSYETIILAGGQSKRFGTQKCCFKFLGKPLLEWVLKEFEQAIIVCKRDVLECISSYKEVKVILEDDNEYYGPVVAIKRVLNLIKSENVFITGCDYPFIKRNIADLLCSREGDIRLLFDNEFQPLLACYSVKFLRENINKVSKMRELISLANEVYLLGINELRIIDPTLNSIKNINTINDFFKKNKNFTISRYIVIENIKFPSLYKNMEYYKGGYNE